MKNSCIMLLTDILLTAAIILSTWYFGYCVPQNGIPALPSDNMTVIKTSEALSENISELVRTKNIKSADDWHKKFADKFSDTVISTENSYRSPDISIELTKGKIATDRMDYSENGKHKKYGTDIAYTLADIYIGDISCFRTAFAHDTYGIGYSEKLSDMSDRIRSVLAVNGDSYNNNRHKSNGTIIRNGIIYRSAPTMQRHVF